MKNEFKYPQSGANYLKAEIERNPMPPAPKPAAHTFVPPMKYDGKFTVSYNLSDGTSSAFRVIPEVGQKIVTAVNCHEELVNALKDIYETVLTPIPEDDDCMGCLGSHETHPFTHEEDCDFAWILKLIAKAEAGS